MTYRAAFAALLLSPAVLPASGVPEYRYTDLGALGGRESRAWAINARGDAVGEAETGDGAMRAVLWEAGKPPRDLGTLGGRTSRALAINDRGAVAGEAQNSEGATVAFLWTPEAGMTNLALPRGAIGSCAQAIGPFGLVAGAVEFEEGSRPAVWTIDGHQALFGGTNITGACYAVDDAGRVAGQLQAGPGEDNAFVARAFAIDTTSRNTAARFWPSAPGEDGEESSCAYALAPNGDAAGYREVAAGKPRACRMKPGGAVIDLDPENHVHSCAYGVSEEGWVVGAFTGGRDDDERAFVHDGKALHDLNGLTREGKGILLVEARDINAKGQIVGRAVAGGHERAFLLNPALDAEAEPPAAAGGAKDAAVSADKAPPPEALEP